MVISGKFKDKYYLCIYFNVCIRLPVILCISFDTL